MGEAPLHINESNGGSAPHMRSAEAEAERLRDEISAIRLHLSEEIRELDRRREEAVYRLRRISGFVIAGTAGLFLLLLSLMPFRGRRRAA